MAGIYKNVHASIYRYDMHEKGMHVYTYTCMRRAHTREERGCEYLDLNPD